MFFRVGPENHKRYDMMTHFSTECHCANYVLIAKNNVDVFSVGPENHKRYDMMTHFSTECHFANVWRVQNNLGVFSVGPENHKHYHDALFYR